MSRPSAWHPLDVRVLLGVFQALLDNGATVIVIEHDLDVIRNADYVIDMGPGGGDAGRPDRRQRHTAGDPGKSGQHHGAVTLTAFPRLQALRTGNARTKLPRRLKKRSNYAILFLSLSKSRVTFLKISELFALCARGGRAVLSFRSGCGNMSFWRRCTCFI